MIPETSFWHYTFEVIPSNYLGLKYEPQFIDTSLLEVFGSSVAPDILVEVMGAEETSVPKNAVRRRAILSRDIIIKEID